MPDLAESLQGRDLGHLYIVANFWGIELAEQEVDKAILHISDSIINPANFNAMLNRLPVEARTALDNLARHAGRIAWAQFSRAYGEIREMGAARRDREKPQDHPATVAEVLWYRGLIARAFFDSPTGPEEFTFIPNDLLELMPQQGSSETSPLGRQASTAEYAYATPATDRILDHACTFLAASRLGSSLTEVFSSSSGEQLTALFLRSLLSVNGLLDQEGLPIPEPVRAFLEAKRGEALWELYRAWKQSTVINELCLLPELTIEGNWENDPARTRQLLLEYLAGIPANVWWSITSFISALKKRNPDFQRPAGDYDSWFIRSTTSGEYLRGFDHWDEVDGRLIRFIITGPLHWLGVLDLGRTDEGHEVSAFKLSTWAEALLHEQPPGRMPVEDEQLLVRSDGRVTANRLVPRRVRYQLARFCEWEKETADEYQYRISAASLDRARKQGLKASQLLSILNRQAKIVPPSLARAIEDWEKHGSLVRVEKVVVLRVVSEEVLQALRKSRAGRFLGESISPTAVTVRPGAIDKVMSALAELGYLGDVRGDQD